jgi:hypothetical protein
MRSSLLTLSASSPYSSTSSLFPILSFRNNLAEIRSNLQHNRLCSSPNLHLVKDLQNFLFCLAKIDKGGNFSTKPQSFSQEQETPFNKHTSLLQPNAITHRRLPVTTTTATLQQNCLKQNSSFSPSLVKKITYTAKHRDQYSWSRIAFRVSNLCSKHPKPEQEEDQKQQQRQTTGNGKNRCPNKSYLNKNTRLSNFSRLRNRTRNTQFLKTHQKQPKTITKRATSERISFHQLQNDCFRKKKENTTTTTRRSQSWKYLLTKFPSESGFRIRNAKRARESRASASLSWAAPAALSPCKKNERTNKLTNELWGRGRPQKERKNYVVGGCE